MKTYWMRKGSFANQYDLYYAENANQAHELVNNGYERISRKEAIHLCALENYRRKYDRACSGYADNLIIPADMDGYDGEDLYKIIDEGDNRRYKHFKAYLDGYLVCRA